MTLPKILQDVKDIKSGDMTIEGTKTFSSPINADITGFSADGQNSFVGEIKLWYGELNSDGNPVVNGIAKTNWHVCDGTSGTPDMRGRVAVGVASGETLGEISGADTVTPSITCDSATQSVSIGNTTLVENQLPSISGNLRDIACQQNNVFLVPEGHFSTFQSGSNYGYGTVASGTVNDSARFSFGSSNSHTHTVTSTSHTHTLSISSFNNRQASRSLHYIMRVS